MCLSDVQNDVVRTIEFDDCDDHIQPLKSDVTGIITEPQVDIACLAFEQ